MWLLDSERVFTLHLVILTKETELGETLIAGMAFNGHSRSLENGDPAVSVENMLLRFLIIQPL